MAILRCLTAILLLSLPMSVGCGPATGTSDLGEISDPDPNVDEGNSGAPDME